MGYLKLQIEIPQPLYRQLKASAASEGKTLKTWVNEAIAEKVRQLNNPPWMKGFGQLRHLREETRRIERVIADEFSRIEPEDWN